MLFDYNKEVDRDSLIATCGKNLSLLSACLAQE